MVVREVLVVAELMVVAEVLVVLKALVEEDTQEVVDRQLLRMLVVEGGHSTAELNKHRQFIQTVTRDLEKYLSL